jgi:hypothetical protein
MFTRQRRYTCVLDCAGAPRIHVRRHIDNDYIYMRYLCIRIIDESGGGLCHYVSVLTAREGHGPWGPLWRASIYHRSDARGAWAFVAHIVAEREPPRGARNRGGPPGHPRGPWTYVCARIREVDFGFTLIASSMAVRLARGSGTAGRGGTRPTGRLTKWRPSVSCAYNPCSLCQD